MKKIIDRKLLVAALTAGALITPLVLTPLHMSVLPLMQASMAAVNAPQEGMSETLSISCAQPGKPFPHFWEHFFGSGRAILSLREEYRNDLRKIKSVADVQYVRFHNIFHREVGLYDEDKDGKPIYNFSYIDQIYDGLLHIGVRPFVELSFMPEKMSEKPNQTHPTHKPNIAPPKDYSRWGDMIYQFCNHLVQRYGVDEVSQWYFEVWNEPNIGFWGGEPYETTYYQLYDASAAAIKKVSPRLRVGGPATAQAAWADRFIAHCVSAKVPVDFVSTHVYANDSSKDVFGTDEKIPRSEMVSRAMRKVYDQVKASPKPNLPIIWSEFNASFFNEVDVTDSPFLGPWLANLIREGDGLADEVSLWTFCDVFEEGGPAKKPFYGGFGMIANGEIPKAGFNAYKILHYLGNQRIPLAYSSAIATKKKNGSVVLAVWNYAPPEHEQTSPPQSKLLTINLSGLTNAKQAKIHLLDKDHGSALTAWEAMGKPDYPTREQVVKLKAAAELPPPTVQSLGGGDHATISLKLEPQALAVIEVGP